MPFLCRFFLILPLIILIALISFQYLRKILHNFYGFLTIILISIILGGYWGYAWAVGIATSYYAIHGSIYGISIIGVLLFALYSMIIYLQWFKNHPFWLGFALGSIIFNIIAIKMIIVYGGWENYLLFDFNSILINIFPNNQWLQIPITVLPVMFYSFVTGSIYFVIKRFFK